MPRDLPLGNGRLLICFDQDYRIRDLYYPHVGQENHVGGRACRLGVAVDGAFAWSGPHWRRDLRYQADTLVTEVTLAPPGLGLILECRDAVDFHEDILVRVITVENLELRTREVNLFFSLDLSISGNDVGDTAAYDPKTGGVVHYKGARYFLANGAGDGNGGVDQFAVGQKGVAGKEGTYKDAEDGRLSGNPIAQGSVDSVMAVKLVLAGGSRGQACFWVAAGQSWEEVRRLDGLVKYKGPQVLIDRTADYWRLWVRKETLPLERLAPAVGELYRRSLLILTTQIDGQGGILAATDSDVLNFNRDTYSYIWPRDGALVAHALGLAGYPEMARAFYQFMAARLEPEGYLLHKYNPDGTLASSWHAWYEGGQAQLPIQEDSTALVIWALWHHFVLYRDVEFIKPLYRPLIKKAADFLCAYRDAETGLPGESFDLWEERRGIMSFTVGAVFGGLTAASLFCKVFGEDAPARRCQEVASEIRDAASTHLWRQESGRFCRRLYRDGDGRLQVDDTLDASLWGLFAFGLYSAADPRLQPTMEALRRQLWVQSEVGGLARYPGDDYYRVDPGVPGNPWLICTLWLADYLLERSEGEEDLAAALELVEWAVARALPSGVLAEQFHPHGGEPLSVAPLTWSHGTYVATVHRILRRLSQQLACPTCGATFMPYLRRDDWIERLYGQTCESIHGICKI